MSDVEHDSTVEMEEVEAPVVAPTTKTASSSGAVKKRKTTTVVVVDDSVRLVDVTSDFIDSLDLGNLRKLAHRFVDELMPKYAELKVHYSNLKNALTSMNADDSNTSGGASSTKKGGKKGSAEPKEKTKRQVYPIDLVKSKEAWLVQVSTIPDSDWETFRGAYITDFNLHDAEKRPPHFDWIKEKLLEKGIKPRGVTSENMTKGKYIADETALKTGDTRENAKFVYIGKQHRLGAPSNHHDASIWVPTELIRIKPEKAGKGKGKGKGRSKKVVEKMPSEDEDDEEDDGEDAGENDQDDGDAE